MTQNKEPTVLHFVRTVRDKVWYQNDRTPKDYSSFQKKLAFGTKNIYCLYGFGLTFYEQNWNFLINYIIFFKFARVFFFHFFVIPISVTF